MGVPALRRELDRRRRGRDEARGLDHNYLGTEHLLLLVPTASRTASHGRGRAVASTDAGPSG